MGDFLRAAGDYWIFCLLALAAFAGAGWALGRKTPRARLPRAFWLSLVAVLAAGFFYVDAAGRRPQQRLVSLLEGIAPIYAEELSRMGHAELRVETAAGDTRYLAMIDALKRWVAINPLISDIYTFRRDDSGKVYLMVDAETDYDGDGVLSGERESRTTPGEAYPQAGPELRAAFEGRANFMDRPVTDRWGTWVSVHVPMRDAAGRIEAVLGVDYRADLWRAENAERRLVAIIYLGVVLVILLGSGAAIAVYRAELSAREEAERRLLAGLADLERENADRRAAEAARRESDARLALHVEHTPLAYVEWAPDLSVTRWNPAAERIFGYTAEEACGRSFPELIVPPAARAEVAQVCRELAERRSPVRHSNENTRRDGGVIVCEWHNTPLIDARGEVLGVASHAQDITERVRIEQHLRHAQKMESMGQLAGGVAHEFNNLLTPMLLQMGQVQLTYADDPRLIEMLRPVEDAIMQAAQLNQRILAVGRRQPETHALGALNPMVEAAVDLLRHTLDRRIELRVEPGAGLPPAWLSKGAIVQIVMNLALNARDAVLARCDRMGDREAPPRIVIGTSWLPGPPSGAPERVCKGAGCLVLSVTDNGDGMSPELQRRVFEPFFTTKPAGKGTGLGLAVVWGVVESLGGHVELRSEPGEGATFTVFLPAANREDASEGEQARGSLPRVAPAVERLRVLLVEDNALVRDTLGSVLRQAGHDVAWAEDGEAGLAALLAAEARPFDLLISDLNLPRLSGRDMLARAGRRGWARGVVVISGVVEPGVAAELRALGAGPVLRKPVGMAELLEAVNGFARPAAHGPIA